MLRTLFRSAAGLYGLCRNSMVRCSTPFAERGLSRGQGAVQNVDDEIGVDVDE